MASNAPVSVAIDAVLEQLGAAMTDTAPAPTPATLYAQLLRIRDEAVLLEVRASDRDTRVHALLADLASAANRLERLEGIALPAVTTVAALAARRAGIPVDGTQP
jgi:hypothetical protein